MGRAAGRAVPRDRTAGLGPRRTHTGVWLGGLDYLGMAIPHFAAIFFVGSRFASRGGRLRNDLAQRFGGFERQFERLKRLHGMAAVSRHAKWSVYAMTLCAFSEKSA